MWKFDGHVHSDASDGTDTAEELAAKAVRAQLDGFALTDHDVLPNRKILTSLERTHGIEIVPGIELSTSYRGRSTHLLAYLPQTESEELRQLLKNTRAAREERLREIVSRIGADYPSITWERLTLRHIEREGNTETPWGRPHVADLLVEEGIAPDRSAVFKTLLNHRGPYFVPQWAADPREAAEIVCEAGGAPILAHPFSGERQSALPTEIIGEMADAGLRGIERDHREHGPEQRQLVDHLAADLNLIVTGGSDYHGAGKPNRLGENLTAKSAVGQLLRLPNSGSI